MKAIVLTVASSLILVLALAAPARAQSALLCGCYCGIAISPPCSEQACKAACGYSEGQGSGRGSGPTQLWYCRALAPGGAWGWAHSPSESGARQAALNECRMRAPGCEIEACRINDPSLAQAPVSTPQFPPGQGQTAPEPAWCDVCTRKLQNDVYSRWASALVRSYVGQAIAGYENCKRRVGGVCPTGDVMAEQLKKCSDVFFDAYRRCVSRAARLSGDQE